MIWAIISYLYGPIGALIGAVILWKLVSSWLKSIKTGPGENFNEETYETKTETDDD